MDSKMPKSQELSEQLQNEKLEAIGGRGLDNQVKNLSLRGKVARWAAVAATAAGISVGMAIPAQAINRTKCDSVDLFQITQGHGTGMCFANKGHIEVVISDVHKIYSGNNAGEIWTNKGVHYFAKNSRLNFFATIGTVTIYLIRIY